MDEKIAVLTDTNSGITPEQAARYGIYLVAMPVIIDDETYFENESMTRFFVGKLIINYYYNYTHLFYLLTRYILIRKYL